MARRSSRTRRKPARKGGRRVLAMSNAKIMPERLANALQATTALVVGRISGGRPNSLVRMDLSPSTSAERITAPAGLCAGEFTGGSERCK
jgi:hypothetical protein